jgi:protein PsiE
MDKGSIESNSMEDRPVRDLVLGKVVTLSEYIGLVIITIATIYSGIQEVLLMVSNQAVTLGDLLLLFLYLEVLAMVGVYLKSGKLPIRFPIYIAIVSLARLVILDMKELTEWEMIAIASTITLLTFAVLAMRFGHNKYPYKED